MTTERPCITSRKALGVLAAVAILALLLTSCAPGVNPEIDTAPDVGNVAGFWMGLWHGIIVPVSFVISLFTGSVNLYEVHNSDNWYDLGFVLGAGVLFGGGRTGYQGEISVKGDRLFDVVSRTTLFRCLLFG